jgi:hypothetical protein
MELCQELVWILHQELKLGNQVRDTIKEGYSRCLFEVKLKHVFQKDYDQLALDRAVKHHRNRDAHYPLEETYYCTKHQHAISAP